MRRSLHDPDSDIFQAKCASAARSLGIGNCGEMASVALVRLWHLNVPAEKFGFDPGWGDHAFVVIGRRERSDPRDYHTWGESAVVCDPWSRTFYPAYLMETHLCNYVGNEVGGMRRPRVMTFDQDQHGLTLASSSVDTFKEQKRVS